MPILLRVTWKNARHEESYGWRCSLCRAAFGEAPMLGQGYSRTYIEEINCQFEIHCQQVHPAVLPVKGISYPLDVSKIPELPTENPASFSASGG